MRLTASIVLFMTFTCCGFAEPVADAKPLLRFMSPASQANSTKSIWKKEELFTAPQVFPVENSAFVECDGIRPVYYEGAGANGKSTRVFAWVGIPENVKQPVPGIVLVHGGGGTAFRDWVKLWMSRGYAAIAMDTNGSVPLTMDGVNIKTERNPFAPATGLYFQHIDNPVESQWLYHAVAAVVRAHSLLISLPGVDPEKTGITGISWGGIITEIAVSVDSRFKFAAPVYGCGFLGENSFWLETDFQKLPPAQVERWISLWDPSQHLSGVTMPMLFCNGTNDKHFRPDSWQKTYLLPQGPVALSLKIGMGHGHPPTGDPKEITVFADSYAKGGAPLTKVLEQGREGNRAWVSYSIQIPIRGVNLVYTQDTGDWVKRRWLQTPAFAEGARASVSLPEGVSAYYFNIQDNRGCIVSSQHQTAINTKTP